LSKILHMSTSLEKKFWESSNFWTTLALAVGAAIVALGGAQFPDDATTKIVAGIFGVFAAGNVLRNYIKNLKLTGKFGDLFKSPNFIASLLTFLVGVFPWLPVEPLQDLFEAIVSGNLQAILIAAFNIVNIIYHLFLKPKLQASV